MKQRKSTIQPVRDAAVLLALILLFLTVRPIGVEAVGQLMPETEASGESQPGADITDPSHDRIDADAPVVTELPGLEILTLDRATEIDLGGKVVCRITRSAQGVATNCSRVVTVPGASEAAPISWSDSCQKQG